MNPSGIQAPGSRTASDPHTGRLHNELHEVDVMISPSLQKRELRHREAETLAQDNRARVPTGVYPTSKPFTLSQVHPLP